VNRFGFLAHFLDPFQLLDPVLWLISDSGEAAPVSLEQLADRDEALVTYDAPRLIAVLRRDPASALGGHSRRIEVIKWSFEGSRRGTTVGHFRSS